MNYIDVNPAPVAAAARATAATEDSWDGWANRSEQALRSAASGSAESVVTAAFETYLGDLNPRLKSVAHLAKSQGVNLAQAVNTAVDSDIQGNHDLSPALTMSQSPTYSRPINAG